MAGYDVIIYLFTNLFRVYVIERFLRAFLGRGKLSRKKEIWVYGAFYFINSICYLWFDIPILNLAVNFIGLNLVAIVYSDTFRKRSLIVLMVMALNMVCEGIFAAVFTAYKIKMSDNAMATVLSVLSFFVLEFFLERKTGLHNSCQLRKSHWLTLMLIPIGSIAVIAFMFINDAGKKYIIVFSTLIIFAINVVAFYLYDSVLQSYSREWERQLLEEQVRMYEKQFTIQKQSQEKIKALRHDIKSHMKKIYDLLQVNEIAGALSYLRDMGAFVENKEEYVSTGNEKLDSILNYMAGILIEAGAEMEFKIHIPAEMNIAFFDINVIMDNLLQNVLEAISFCTDKKVYIEMKYLKGILFILIQNTYDGKLEIKGKEIVTRKKQKENHGIGLKNVKKIVEKYSGDYQISTEGNIFSTTIFLYLKEV